MKVKFYNDALGAQCVKGAAAALVALGLTSVAQADGASTFKIQGNAEINTDAILNYKGTDDDNFDQGGRIKITTTGRHDTDFGFVAAEAELLLGEDGNTGVDEAYVKFGQKNWSLLFGRYENSDLFSKGVDTIHRVIGTAGDNFYQANAARGRGTGDAGQIVFEAKPTDRFRFELGTLWGEVDSSNAGLGGIDDDEAVTGVRPLVEFDVTDDFRVTAGYDYVDDDNTEIKGYGLYLRYATDQFAVKANYAQGESETGSTTNWDSTSYNINLETGPFGIGYTRAEEDVSGEDADTVYGNYTINNLMGVKSAQAKLAFSASSASDVDEDEVALRLRINYDF